MYKPPKRHAHEVDRAEHTLEIAVFVQFEAWAGMMASASLLFMQQPVSVLYRRHAKARIADCA